MTPSFVAVYEAELDHVWRTLRRFGVESRHIEDVAQEVFVTVHRRLPTYDPSLPIRPWVTGISVKIAANHRARASTRREVVEDEIEAEDAALSTDELLDRARAQRLVQRALQALDDKSRPVVAMHDLDGHSIPEIAQALEIPLNTAYSRLRRGRESLVTAIRKLQRSTSR